MQENIVIRGVRQNNLKGFDLTLPRNKLIVFTGLSGCGKSSLAFDTLYAEGQRRYVESLSSYARQFLGQMEKPDVDSIDGLSPAISIDQKTTSKNPRSTVGTVTEIHDYLRLLYARVGVAHCPRCGREISKQTVDQMVDRLLALPGAHAHAAARAGRARQKGRTRQDSGKRGQAGLCPRPDRRGNLRRSGSARAGQTEKAQHRGRRRPPDSARRYPAPA